MWRLAQLVKKTAFFLVAGALVCGFPAFAKPDAMAAAKTQGASSKKQTSALNPKTSFSFNGKKDIDGMVLKQEYRFIGKTTTYFSPAGIRLESATLNVLYNAKTQMMCVFSDETKKFYECDPETWKKKSKIMFKNTFKIVKRSPWKYVKDEKIAGLSTKAYKQVTDMKSMSNEDTLWITQDVQLGKDERGLMIALLKVNGDVPPGVPVRHELNCIHKEITHSDRDFLGRRRVRKDPDRKEIDYETFSQAKTKIPISKYSMAPGYTRAESEMEVFFNQDDALGGLDEPDFGVDNKAVKSKLKELSK